MSGDGTVTIGVGIEDIEPDHWVAWVFGVPGCFSAARREPDALAEVVGAYTGDTGDRRQVIVEVRERWRVSPADDDPDFLVNACFDDDRRPLSSEDVRDGVARLEANRRRLTAILGGSVPDDADIMSIISHMATAERWYLAQFGLALAWPPAVVDPLERLRWVRGLLLAALPTLVSCEDVVGHPEAWTPRKLLRRSIWHERDHTAQIERLLGPS